ncbi:MAG: hypothetical protein JST54_24740 [Deltaproteobacteria bacterium]|nr:hypothetical protein [Deltaproteobacteria bacterium]
MLGLVIVAVLSSIGQAAPELALPDTAGHVRHLEEERGRPVVIVYEDRHATEQNAALKRELGERARNRALAHEVTLWPIANLVGLDFWPARGFARDAVVRTARELGVEILMDWTGEAARRWGFPAKVSTVVIVDRAGQVRFRHEGALSPAERAAFFDTLTAVLQERP